MSLIGIYKITSPTGRIYIGQSWDFKKRVRDYKNPPQYKGQTKLYNSMMKYGYDNHIIELITELPLDITQEVLDRYETIYWQQYKDLGFRMMNIRLPGSRGKHSEETKEKIRVSKKGKKLTEEHKRKIGIASRKWIRGEDFKAKISKAHKGKTSERKGKTLPEETVVRMKEAAKKNTNRKEENRKMIETRRINKSGNYPKTIIQYDLNGNFVKEWESATKAAKEGGFWQTAIWKCLNEKGRYKTTGGCIWKYK